MYRWDFAPVLANADLLVAGLVNTLRVTGTALVVGVALGLALALLRLSGRRLASWPAGFVIEVFRTTPPLVQLFWFFFALPLVVGIEMTPFMAAATTFSIQSAAFFAEVFRGGIASVERGQWDAARAIELMKTTTLVATISYADLLYAANEISQRSFRPLETFTVAALVYFGVITVVSQAARRLERRLAVSGESTVR